MNVDYNSQQYFKGREKQYDRFELKKMWCDLPQNKRTVDLIYNMTGIPKYHIKGLMKADNWKEEARKEDEFRVIAKRNEQEMMSEENRNKFLEEKYAMDKKMFNVSSEILNSDEFTQKIKDIAGEVKTLRDIKDLYTLLMTIQDNYRESIGLGKPDKVNLTQNNYYDLRNSVRDQIMADGADIVGDVNEI